MPNRLENIGQNSTALTVLATVLMSGLFLLKGNTINVECVGCLYDPNTKGAQSTQVADAKGKGLVSEKITRGQLIEEVDYNCNVLIPGPFRTPPKTPLITDELLATPDKLIPILTKLASEQRQYIHDHDRYVRELVETHNTLCK